MSQQRLTFEPHGIDPFLLAVHSGLAVTTDRSWWTTVFKQERSLTHHHHRPFGGGRLMITRGGHGPGQTREHDDKCRGLILHAINYFRFRQLVSGLGPGCVDTGRWCWCSWTKNNHDVSRRLGRAARTGPRRWRASASKDYRSILQRAREPGAVIGRRNQFSRGFITATKR